MAPGMVRCSSPENLLSFHFSQVGPVREAQSSSLVLSRQSAFCPSSIGQGCFLFVRTAPSQQDVLLLCGWSGAAACASAWLPETSLLALAALTISTMPGIAWLPRLDSSFYRLVFFASGRRPRCSVFVAGASQKGGFCPSSIGKRCFLPARPRRPIASRCPFAFWVD